jgi:hypothetical protein
VILEYQGRGYHVASDLMTRPADMNDLAAKIQRIRDKSADAHGSWPDAAIGPELWGTMRDLIYTGHRILAWQFLDMAWPRNVAGKRRRFHE